MKAYKTIIRPVALYGSQTWAVTKKTEQKMNIAKMRIAKQSLGVTRLHRIFNTKI